MMESGGKNVRTGGIEGNGAIEDENRATLMRGKEREGRSEEGRRGKPLGKRSPW